MRWGWRRCQVWKYTQVDFFLFKTWCLHYPQCNVRHIHPSIKHFLEGQEFVVNSLFRTIQRRKWQEIVENGSRTVESDLFLVWEICMQQQHSSWKSVCVCVCVSCLGVSHWEWEGPRQSFRKRAPHLSVGLWLKAKCMKKKKEQQLTGSTSKESSMQSESFFIFPVFYCPLLPFCLLKASVGYSFCWDLVLWVQWEEQQTVWRKLKSLTYSGGSVFVCLSGIKMTKKLYFWMNFRRYVGKCNVLKWYNTCLTCFKWK